MEQKVYTELSLMEALAEVLALYKPKKILLITGKQSYISSGAKKSCDPLFKNIIVTTFNDFFSNPTLEEVKNAISVFKESNPDIVLAIGGGSAIDLAKSVNVLAGVETENLPRYIKGDLKIPKKEKPLIAVPTTAGSGAEATHFAVVYIGGIKHSLADENLLPDIVIVDSTLTHSLSPYQTAVTGLDALSQAVESMWSVKATEESIQYSRESLALTFKYLPVAVHDPTDEAREKMALAAHLAGKAINIAKTTASHAMSYPMTAKYGIPHGHAVALTLPEVLLFNSNVSNSDICHPKGVEYVKNTMGELARIMGLFDSKDAAFFLKSFVSSLGVETELNKLGVSENDIKEIVSEMSLERAGNNPRKFTPEDASAILGKIFKT